METNGLNGWALIQEERERQVHEEGFTLERDDKYLAPDLVSAGVAYALHARWQLMGRPGSYGSIPPTTFWPWVPAWWKPSGNPIRNLVKAGALIAAEIDKLQRATAMKGSGQ